MNINCSIINCSKIYNFKHPTFMLKNESINVCDSFMLCLYELKRNYRAVLNEIQIMFILKEN